MPPARCLVVFVVLSVCVATAPTLAQSDRTGGHAFVVDDDGDAEYGSIQAAVDDASAGDVVVVREGTYQEQVTVDENVTVRAPDGATLDGRRFETPSRGFRFEPGVVPVVEGFTVRNYSVGISANQPGRPGTVEADWDAGWTVRNVTILDCTEGIGASSTLPGATVENVRIERTMIGIHGAGSYGGWTVRNVVVRNASFDGVRLSPNQGADWTIRNVTVADAGSGIDVGFSDGNGTIADVTVRTVRRGIAVTDSGGTVTVRRAVVENVSHPPDDPALAGVAIRATANTADWTVRDSVVRNYSRRGINASGSDPAGDATGNWWGPDGPPVEACTGAVRCGDPLSERPDAGARLDDPGAPVDAEYDGTVPGGTETASATARTTTRTPAGTDESTTAGSPSPATPTLTPGDATTATGGQSPRREATTATGPGPSPSAVGAAAAVIAGFLARRRS